ncbi:MAG: CPBP family intramembrane metalloprotease [Gemmatimonadetes bacterium]|nr:CPBP family intramembrane metalloprotease [Gemmatimonadota bacterium]
MSLLTSRGWLVAVAGIGGAVAAVRFFADAVPQVSLDQRMSRPRALAAADSFARANALPRGHRRQAVRFGGNDSLQVFLELGAGGKDTLNRVVRGGDVAVYQWRVRSFTPGDVHEVRVRFATDGRVTGFQRKLADADRRPALDSARAQALADTVLAQWMRRDPRQWTVTAHSTLTVPVSARRDHTFTYERRDRRLGDAPIRLEVEIGGDTATGAREFAKIPESFARRYAEMRASNDLTAFVASLGFLLYGLVALVALAVYQRRGMVRWRAALVTAASIAALYGASMLNDLPLAWYDFDTATTERVFLAQQVVAAILAPVLLAAFLLVVVAAGDVLARHAFPRQVDWFRAWRGLGTREVARQVLSGYALCGLGLGYVALFYLAARHWLGWWVPSELLDDPNQIATPMPWVSAIALATQAGVMEEILFRVVPLSAVAVLTRDKPFRRAALIGTAVLTALVFGFAHANYASWPPYSRGVELFAEALLWAFVFLRWGAIPTITCHVIFDLLLFGLFAGAGDALPYRVTLAVVVAVATLPAAMVLAARLRQGGWRDTGDELRFGAWRPTPESVADGAGADVFVPPVAAGSAAPAAGGTPGDAAPSATAPLAAPMPPAVLRVPPTPVAPPAARAPMPLADVRLLLVLFAAWLTFFTPRAEPSLPRYTIDRAEAEAIADSLLRARGGDPAGWRRLTVHRMPDDAVATAYFAAQEADTLERRLARTYLPRALWSVRYVHPDGDVKARAEQWRVRLLADGAPYDVTHRIAEDEPRPAASDAAVRAAARVAAATLVPDTARLESSQFTAEPRPHRRDALVEFIDRTVKLPGDATARVRVQMAEGEALSVMRDLVVPEAFERERRARDEALGLAAMISLALLALLLCGGAIWMVRHKPLLVDDPGPPRRALVAMVAAYAAYLVLRALNGWPAALYEWNTATPWSSHTATSGILVGTASFGTVIVVALWVAADRLRRRVGVPFRLAPGRAGTRETLLSGAALAALPLVVLRLSAIVDNPTGEAALTSTTMDALVPLAGRVLQVLGTVGGLPAVLALPVMVALGITSRPGWRLVPLLLVAALVTAPMVAWSDNADVPAPVLGASVLLCVVSVTPLLARWGRTSVMSWIVAALSFEALTQARLAILAAHPSDHWSATIACVVATAALAAVARWLHDGSRGVA